MSNLTIGFFERVGAPAELAAVTANLPPAVLQLAPAMSEQAKATLTSLEATDHARTVTD
ncbi:hypothetical protein [Streptomyces sp. GQFP]|uniref:hypothetical protein n=1 Tax=Streptomyces sp. GQFP TaxID=2907545 RepID=UPI001F3CCA57|nr:hypothetical protein [Streptomyces sp. GQFP]UIX34825.1 hypothetical protein LUX31_35170 [Streptomyces sp. GQFP]